MEILIFVIYKPLLFQILSKFLYELKLKQNLNPLIQTALKMVIRRENVANRAENLMVVEN